MASLGPPAWRGVVVWLILLASAIGMRGMFPRIHMASWLILAAGLTTVLSQPLAASCRARRRGLSLLLVV